MIFAFKYLFALQLIVIFCAGGLLQLLGLLTNTQTTLAISSLSVACMTLDCLLAQRLKGSAVISWALMAALVIALSSVWNNTDAAYVVAALAIWVLVPATTIAFLRSVTHHIWRRRVYRLFVAIALLQLPIMAAQRIFAGSVQKLSGGAVDEIDVAFGSFFLKSDHAVGFLMVSLVIYHLYGRAHGHSLSARLMLIGWCSATAIYSHSTMSHLLVALLLASYPVVRFIRSLNSYGRATGVLIMVGALVVALIFFWQGLSEELFVLYRDSGIANAGNGEGVARYSMLLKFLNEPVRLLGDGAFSYYNPVAKAWFVYGGHSQWYSIYYDFGLCGCVAFMAFFAMLARVRVAAKAEWAMYVGAFVAYGIVALTFQDLAMLFVLFFFTSWPAEETSNPGPNEVAITV